MTRRDRWDAFVARIDRTAALDDAAFDALVAELHAEPDASLRRACVVHLARLDREVASDDQLRALAALFTGKVPRYIAGALVVRRVRRGEPGALEQARAHPLAFVRQAAAR